MKCTPKLPSAPQNLTVTGTRVNESSVMLSINWAPPAQSNPDVIAYRIWIYLNNSDLLLYANTVRLIKLYFSELMVIL